MKRPPSIGHQFGYDCDSIDSIARDPQSAILVLLQTQKIAGGKNIRVREKIVYTTKLSGLKGFRIQSSHFKFRIQNLRRHGLAKPGRFYVGFVHLCVNGKTNPVLKRFRFFNVPDSSRIRGTISPSVSLV